MRRINFLALVILMLVALALSVSLLKIKNSGSVSAAAPQAPTTTLRRVAVNIRTISALPAGKKYTVDLTQRGVTYEFDPKAGQIDFSRIVVRTSKGEFAIAPLIEKKFLKGKLAGFKYTTLAFSLGSPPLGTLTTLPTKTQIIFCRDLDTCSCTDDDCDDLLRSTLCTDIHFCVKDPISGLFVCSCERRTSTY